MDALLVALGGVAIGLADLLDLGIKRLRVFSALMLEPILGAVRFAIGFFEKSAPPCGARCFPPCRV
jgi:hypothetical protein